MILIDTSIWVDHQRGLAVHLNGLLNSDFAITHPLIIGELACGHLANRTVFLDFLAAMQQCTVAAEDEVLLFVEMHKLYGTGIGYIDAHLLAAATLNGSRLWTRDKRLAKIASALNIHYADLP